MFKVLRREGLFADLVKLVGYHPWNCCILKAVYVKLLSYSYWSTIGLCPLNFDASLPLRLCHDFFFDIIATCTFILQWIKYKGSFCLKETEIYIFSNKALGFNSYFSHSRQKVVGHLCLSSSTTQTSWIWFVRMCAFSRDLESCAVVIVVTFISSIDTKVLTWTRWSVPLVFLNTRRGLKIFGIATLPNFCRRYRTPDAKLIKNLKHFANN